MMNAPRNFPFLISRAQELYRPLGPYIKITEITSGDVVYRFRETSEQRSEKKKFFRDLERKLVMAADVDRKAKGAKSK